MAVKISEKKHWDDFWRRDRDIDEIYDNDGRITEEIGKRLEIKGMLCLEVGAATARDSVTLARSGASAVALDYSMEALALAERAAERAGVQLMLVCGDALNLPFRDDVFDLVFHQGVLEHFRDPVPFLAENSRVVRPGGVVLTDVPQTFHIYTVMKKLLIAAGAWFAGWETQFTRAALCSLLRGSGLEPFGVYGRFFSPSLAYRILREILAKPGINLPMRPVLVPPIHRLRETIRKHIEKSSMGPALGYVLGVFARKPEKNR